MTTEQPELVGVAPEGGGVKGPEITGTLAAAERLLGAIAQKVALIAVAAIVLIAAANVGDIVLRSAFRRSLYGLNEINAMLVAIAVTTCLPQGLLKGAAINASMAFLYLPSRYHGWLRAFSGVSLTVFFGILAWRVGISAASMARFGETTMMTNLPKAPFYYVMAAALGFTSICTAVMTLREIGAARRTTPVAGLVLMAAIGAVLAHIVLAILGLVSADMYSFLRPSNSLLLAALAFAAMWVGILFNMPLGAAMGLTGIIGTAAIIGVPGSLASFGQESIAFVTQDSMSVLPLFLLMGAFASVAGIGADLYRLTYALIGHIRGGLVHASILACAGFGTLTGSAVATQMTIGKIAMGEMRQRNYSPALSAGAIAAGGTLGQLIPPSSALIIYAVMTHESVGKLFVGAIIPGLIATILYMACAVIWLWLRPGDAEPGPRSSLREVAAAARGSWSVLLLLGVVLGGIYTGLFTELEAGSVGVVGGLLLALVRGRLNPSVFWKTMGETTMTLAMMYSLIFGVTMLSFFFGISGVPQAFITFVEQLGLWPIGVVIALVACYLILGTAMDDFAMMIITVPVFAPVVVGLGFDPIWWGVLTIICMEAGMISPPFGINIFIIKSLDPDIPLSTVFRGCWPFFASAVVKIVLLLAFPVLVTWLPSTM